MSEKEPHPSDHDKIVRGPVVDYAVAASIYPDPKYLYSHDAFREKSVWVRYMPFVMGIGTGTGFVFLKNWMTRKPLYAGVHRIPFWICVMTFTYWGFREVSRKYFNYRDRIYRHYISLHPEDFPPPQKVKIGDLWEDWHPTSWRA